MKSGDLIPLLLALVGCTTARPLAPMAEQVDISALLANPVAYQDKLVHITGAVVARFEAEFICPSAGQIDSDRSKECLWLAPGIGEGFAPEELPRFHKKIVVLIGRFNKDFLGHMGAYGGTIVPIHVQIIGSHSKGDIPPAPPEPSSNNSFKPNPLRRFVQ
ncbi:hypothetical protein SNE34_14750, partial [Lysobacter erysipheiresistens]